jgi:hypothetical protein
MTIEIHGFVYAMSKKAKNLDVCLELRVEGIRSLENLFINASDEEVAHYKPGMAIKIQIRPNPPTPDGLSEPNTDASTK